MEGFNYELAMQLSYMYDRAKVDKKHISRILDAKNQILNGQGVFEDDKQMINRILDDAIKLQQICEIYLKEFGKYVYTSTDMDYLIDDEIENGEMQRAKAKLDKIQQSLKKQK